MRCGGHAAYEVDQRRLMIPNQDVFKLPFDRVRWVRCLAAKCQVNVHK